MEKNSEISKVNLEAEHQKNIKFIILGVVIILIIAIAIVIRSLIGKQKANKVLELRQQIINEKNEELNQQNEEILAQRDQIEHQNKKLELKSQLVTESINTARRIQTAFFHSEEKEKKLLGNYFAFFKPKDIVSGDFYWSNINEENPNIIYISVADCTGHGVPGALMSMLGLSFINEILNENPQIYPSDLLEKLRTKVIIELGQKEANQTKEGMDMSVVRIDTTTNEVTFAGANNPMYVIRNTESKAVEIFKGTKQPIGISEITKPFTQSTHQLAKGDMIYLFSDGYPDQFGGSKGKKMGYKNFREILLNVSELPVDLQKIEVENQFDKWRSTEEQIDDVCVLGIRI